METNRVINGSMGVMQKKGGGHKTVRDVADRWQQYRVQTTLHMHRQGWTGVWDAFAAAVRGEPRLTVETPVTISFWAKGATPAIAINGMALEVSPVSQPAP